jgi:hypothetical protein
MVLISKYFKKVITENPNITTISNKAVLYMFHLKKRVVQIKLKNNWIKKKVKAEQYGEHFGSLQIKYVDIPIKVYNIGQTMPKT